MSKGLYFSNPLLSHAISLPSALRPRHPLLPTSLNFLEVTPCVTLASSCRSQLRLARENGLILIGCFIDFFGHDLLNKPSSVYLILLFLCYNHLPPSHPSLVSSQMLILCPPQAWTQVPVSKQLSSHSQWAAQPFQHPFKQFNLPQG